MKQGDRTKHITNSNRNGGGIIGYYLTPALETIGINGTMQQLGIQLGNVAIYFVFTLFGAYIIDMFRRRTLIFVGITLVVIFQIAVTITSWQWTANPTETAAILTVVWMYCFQVASATTIATMHNLYPVEILSLPLRAKGMGLYSMIQVSLFRRLRLADGTKYDHRWMSPPACLLSVHLPFSYANILEIGGRRSCPHLWNIDRHPKGWI